MASHNRVILLGNVTRDIELKYTSSGLAVTDMGMAVNDRRKNQQTGEWIEEVTFVQVTLWGRTAEIAGEYLSKGSPVFIEGRLKLDTWEQDGKKHSKLHVVGERLQLIGSRQGGSGGTRGGGGGQPQYDTGDYGEPDAGPSPRSAAVPRPAQAAAPPPGDDIPF
ncbi:MAG TPA: single-stranded DNA-binding protein [Pirellulaceae bacterium]|nr:single-stranded DNA-binding protein [Pirellulaceae bacterium]